MQIDSIRVYPLVENLWYPWCIVVVETNDGMRGVGEAGGLWGNEDLDAKVAHGKKFEEQLIGKDPMRIEDIRIWAQEAPWGLSRLNQELLSGIEIACWDLKGKYHYAPVHEMLGGKVRDEVRVYANGWYDGLDSPEEWADGAQSVIDRGYDALKFDPFGSAFRDIDNPEFRLALDRVEAIRSSVGHEPDLLIEGHGRLNPGIAIKVGDELTKYDPTWFEAPVRPSQGPEAFREVREALSIPIADDLAGIGSKFDAFDYVSTRAVDIIQPDVTNVGGLRECQYIAQMADAAGIFTCPHVAGSPVSLLASIHVDAVIPNIQIQEGGFNEFISPDWMDDVFDVAIEVDNGRIAVPCEPGLGVTFDEDCAVDHAANPLATDEFPSFKYH